MQYLDAPWDVNTRCSRRPTPTAFEHLREYTDLDEKYVEITDPVQLQEVQDILNNQYNLYLSNEIQYVIAQLLGSTGTEFETIKSDGSGNLNVNVQDIGATATQSVSVADGLNVALGAVADAIVAAGAAGTISAKLRRLTQGIEDLKTGIEAKAAGTSKTMITAAISDSDGGNVLAITANATKKHKITTILLTVAGQTNIQLLRGATPLSGPMDFGGTDEPRGMVSNHGDYPLETAVNEAFNITSSAAVQVSGYVIYYTEA